MKYNNKSLIKSYTPTQEELDKINVFTRRKLLPEEVYIFSVILCDNEIDRDFERFTVKALEKLATMYVGKTGIFDHDHKGKNQTARIFDTQINQDTLKKTSIGEVYTCILAKAYMIKTDKNKDLILELDGGIKKEVSVGCSVGQTRCSICNNNAKSLECKHNKGQYYDNKLCHTVLDEPTDAYEWSFVAVPAQVNAGVIKGFKKEKGGSVMEGNATQLIKKLRGCSDDVVISKKEANNIANELDELQKKAQFGENYRNDLIKEVSRLAFLAKDCIDADVLLSVANKMDICELKGFKAAYETKVNSFEGNCQLYSKSDNSKPQENNEFKI